MKLNSYLLNFIYYPFILITVSTTILTTGCSDSNLMGPQLEDDAVVEDVLHMDVSDASATPASLIKNEDPQPLPPVYEDNDVVDDSPQRTKIVVDRYPIRLPPIAVPPPVFFQSSGLAPLTGHSLQPTSPPYPLPLPAGPTQEDFEIEPRPPIIVDPGPGVKPNLNHQ